MVIVFIILLTSSDSVAGIVLTLCGCVLYYCIIVLGTSTEAVLNTLTMVL